ncbi:uncharacterized protein LY89DRAFT_28812 [Mollisia scopiformis]|uniref:Uncharacterized protein n=1 Tax=Mollisia scopiformis TaxID=149040 RepID=A0A194XDN3_MOLSC|nr:uncharacterized protein LY89DRAFT_28812 [Mollisia scopiformis]KUJ17862.1 hypothetical protein LY89DRAFT_28812 [Mollisia scopiformis]
MFHLRAKIFLTIYSRVLSSYSFQRFCHSSIVLSFSCSPWLHQVFCKPFLYFQARDFSSGKEASALREYLGTCAIIGQFSYNMTFRQISSKVLHLPFNFQPPDRYCREFELSQVAIGLMRDTYKGANVAQLQTHTISPLYTKWRLKDTTPIVLTLPPWESLSNLNSPAKLPRIAF